MLARRHLHSHASGLHHRHLGAGMPHVDRASQFLDGNAATRLAARGDEKPVSASTTNMVIALGVAVPLVVIFIVLIFLHRRNQKRVALEDVDDKYRSLDFGLGENGPAGGKKRKSAFFGKEKDLPSHKVQLSMDMNLSSPYLLPPDLQHSRESLHSLTRSLHKTEDPYRPVTQYTSSDVGSLKGFPRGATTPGLPSMPASPLPQKPPVAQTPQKAEFEDIPLAPPSATKNEFRFSDDEITRQVPSISYPEQVPTIQEPPAAASRLSHKAITETVRPFSGESTTMGQSAAVIVPEPVPASQPPRNDSMPMPVINADGMDASEIQINEPAQESNRASRAIQGGLGVPGKSNNRLSVGFRPLPPDDFLDSEDPEFRANRIRSFYKEYFEDSKQEAAARPPMPPPPQHPQQPQQPQPGGYYEDYDQNYLGEAAYFDPETNAFVMPYAAPVTRRAMTPPPSNRRPMPGPRQRGPPGQMPMPGPPGTPRGRPRAGSTQSAGRWAPMSPRPDSSASNPRFSNNKPRKPMPPPADLNSLPTPSKLKDDSFALFNAAEFAPPPSFKEQAAGRSQSPVGERVPYRAGTPVHSPLVSAFEDTAPLPSPHLLRKSGTFTALDFAPPKRFKDPEVMSDAGSIRSNRSGLSQQNAMALRNGAGRVSRLPGDAVFTQADGAATLKPQWGMRP